MPDDHSKLANKDASILEMLRAEERETGREDLHFVGDSTVSNGEINRVWWRPAEVSGDSTNDWVARCNIGMLYGLQFIAYLRQNKPGGYDVNDDLVAIVEAMTGKELGWVEKTFLLEIARAVSGWPTAIAHAGKDAEFVAVFHDDDAGSTDVETERQAPTGDPAVELYHRWLAADRNVKAVSAQGKGLVGHAAEGQEMRLETAWRARFALEEQLVTARATTAAGLLAKAEVIRVTKGDLGAENVEDQIALSMHKDLVAMFGQIVAAAPDR